MKTYEVVSHLTVKQWKKSWSQKVVEDTKKNVHDVYKNSCFLGHFENDNDFILYFHKEFEGNSLNTFFMGHVEKCKEGCRITGRFTKKKTANIFLIFAAVLTFVTTLAFAVQGAFQMMATPAVLCIIVLACYFVTPQSAQDRLTELLKEISFEDAE